MVVYKHTGQGYGRRRGIGNGLESGIRNRLDTHTDRKYELERELVKS